jgi:Kef-type K+ transport system membrane component KefB
MAVPPFVFGALGLVLAVLISDRFRERSLVATTALTITLTGLIVMVASDNAKLRYGFTNVCLSACFVSSPLGLAWLIVSYHSVICCNPPPR